MAEQEQNQELRCCCCGSDDIELKVWKNLKTGHIDDSAADGDDDHFCNNCEVHGQFEWVDVD